jgi:hypothetical protein
MPSPSCILSSQHHLSSTPAYYNNAKNEEISCSHIKPPYDGLEDHLISFLINLTYFVRMRVGRQQRTLPLKEKDLIVHVILLSSLITEIAITSVTEKCWNSPDVNQTKHTVRHETYNARLIAIWGHRGHGSRYTLWLYAGTANSAFGRACWQGGTH